MIGADVFIRLINGEYILVISIYNVTSISEILTNHNHPLNLRLSQQPIKIQAASHRDDVLLHDLVTISFSTIHLHILQEIDRFRLRDDREL